jgi:hypothetical protein
MNRTKRMLVALGLGAFAIGAGAQGLDGTQRMICAATTSVVCESHDACVSGPPEAVNLPIFWHVDPVAKVTRSKAAEGGERTSKIATVSVEGGALVLQGSDSGFGWSLSMDSKSGKFVFAGGKDSGYLLFGECTTP